MTFCIGKIWKPLNEKFVLMGYFWNVPKQKKRLRYSCTSLYKPHFNAEMIMSRTFQTNNHSDLWVPTVKKKPEEVKHRRKKIFAKCNTSSLFFLNGKQKHGTEQPQHNSWNFIKGNFFLTKHWIKFYALFLSLSRCSVGLISQSAKAFSARVNILNIHSIQTV